jgi:hypothetical protein
VDLFAVNQTSYNIFSVDKDKIFRLQDLGFEILFNKANSKRGSVKNSKVKQ